MGKEKEMRLSSGKRKREGEITDEELERVGRFYNYDLLTLDY